MSRVKPYNVVVTLLVPGTRQQLSTTSKIVRSFLIQAKPSNTGNVFIGSSEVTSTKCTVLSPGANASIEAPQMGNGGADDMDLSDWYLDAATANDQVYITALVRE